MFLIFCFIWFGLFFVKLILFSIVKIFKLFFSVKYMFVIVCVFTFWFEFITSNVFSYVVNDFDILYEKFMCFGVLIKFSMYSFLLFVM